MPNIYSTLACDQNYTNYESGGGDVPVARPAVFIAGGTGVANDRFITPLGVHTEVSDAQLEELERNFVFQMHKKNGFIRVEKKKSDPEKVAADMNLKDPSAPKTSADFTEVQAAS